MSNLEMRLWIDLTMAWITVIFIGGIGLNYAITASSYGWGAYAFTLVMLPLMILIYRILIAMRRKYKEKD